MATMKNDAHQENMRMKRESSPLELDLPSALEQVNNLCNDCGACVKNCAFLQKYGSPGQLAKELADGSAANLSRAYECSLCGLCTTLCPQGCDPSGMFFQARRQANADLGDDKRHGVLRNYEAQGTSPRFTWYALPQDCDTIFFPGCNIPGSRPEIVKLLFQHMQQVIPNLGVVMDCCCKPSHDLGRTDFFREMFGELRSYLLDNGIKKVLCACPNCFKVFSMYGGGLETEMVYALLDANELPQAEKVTGEVCVHDPCPLRNESAVHEAARSILRKKGLKIAPQRRERKKTLCCGEGGAVPCMAPDLAKKWPEIRVKDIQGRPLVTYCAGCALFLGRHTPTHHLLDIIYKPKETLDGRVKPAPSPITYWNRIQLKKWFQRNLPAEAARERSLPYGASGESAGGAGFKGALFAFAGGLLCGFKKIK